MSNYSLMLAHINDTHSNFEPSRVQFSLNEGGKTLQLQSRSGGYARLGFQIARARKNAEAKGCEFLFLHGGDSFQGTLYFREFQGAANAHLLNLLKPDAMVLGNHEIDAGNSPVQAFLNRVDFPVLAGNMDLSQEDSHKPGKLRDHPMLFDYQEQSRTAKVLLRPFHDRTLAIIGITLDQMKLIARPDADTHFANAIVTTANTVRQLKADGIDHIIVLSHLGLDQDRTLAAEVDGISLIVGGHTHTLQGDFSTLGLSHIPYGETVNHTPIVHAGKYAETLGLAEIRFDAQGKAVSLEGNNFFMLDTQFKLSSDAGVTRADHDAATARLRAHPGILWDDESATLARTIAEEYRPALDALENQVLAFIPRELVHTRLPSKNLPHGSEIAPWVSYSMYHQAKELDARVDFALHNAGGVRQSLNQGELTLADVVGGLLPFDLPLVKYEIQGLYLYQALESAIDGATNNGVTGTGAGSFPYTYGLRFHYDGTRVQGQRITRLEILREQEWHSVCHDSHYVGVSSAYTAAGKEGYQALLSSRWQDPLESLTLPGAFISFVGKAGLFDEPLAPHVYYTSHRR
ncbi:bifunctional metallophosphatase/5'-nucleotidase [Shewanella salipaludis]|uniref:Bifunctional metallophosphatase/5'-nucleotidase n=1 Tax=Shewanella salipaludis TaxID=2723052 RepID=A0A972G0X4_9GAMM|nr:bifunctional metallophosphatase/5'-nucleotidase [Shewanella salipaludis]NMH65491.1 bifunctional metallophosphatase/5'-nucleotidase [Shewanella salipaludis]